MRGRTICLQYSVHRSISAGIFAVGTAVGKMGIMVVEEEVVVGLGTVGGKRGRVEKVVGTAVGKIPTAAGVDDIGDAVTGSGDEVLAGDAVTPLTGTLGFVGTAVGKMGTTDTDEETVVEVVTVFVTVNVSTTWRRWNLSGEERVEDMRVVRKKERMVEECIVKVVDKFCNKIRRTARSRIGEVAECKREGVDIGTQESKAVYHFRVRCGRSSLYTSNCKRITHKQTTPLMTPHPLERLGESQVRYMND